MKIKSEESKDLVYKLEQKARKIWVIVVAGLCLTILSSVITVSTSLPIIQNMYTSTIGKKADLIKRIESLVPGTNIDFFKQKLGDPVFINIAKETQSKDYVFVNKLFYVDATTDLNDKVIYYAVTTRDKNFNPKFKSPIFTVNGDQIVVKLGKTKFSEINSIPINEDGCMGAHNWFYYESHYIGNPGNYQTFAFGLNMAGYGVEPTKNDVSDLNSMCSWGKNVKKLEIDETPNIMSVTVSEFRKNNVINTYLVTEPLGDFTPNSLGIGVDYNQVRILN